LHFGFEEEESGLEVRKEK